MSSDIHFVYRRRHSIGSKLVTSDLGYPISSEAKLILLWSSISISVLSDHPNCLFDPASASCGKQHLESKPGKKKAEGGVLMRRKIANASVVFHDSLRHPNVPNYIATLSLSLSLSLTSFYFYLFPVAF